MSSSVPPQCVAGALTGVGAALLVSSYHTDIASLPAPCLLGSFGTLTAVAASLTHHASAQTYVGINLWSITQKC